MNVLNLDKVGYQYIDGKAPVLSDVSINFEKGKLYTIVGSSGAGKSTILSLVSGLDVCTTGKIIYKDQDMTQLDRDDYRAKHIGVIFQSYNLLINATAIENIVLSMNISGYRGSDVDEKAYQLLESMGIEREKADRKVLKLSGGEQQRVGIARAISHGPDIVIADEPTGNLDADTEKNIMTILSDLAHRDGKCVIVVTHSHRVAEYADELWGLNGGNLLFVK